MITIKKCPKCRSTNIREVGGRWMCGDCGHVGTDFIEKEITGGQLDSVNKKNMRWRNK